MIIGEFKVPDEERVVNCTLAIDTAKLKGETSSTATAHKGFKPQVLAVSFFLRFSDAAVLKQLNTLVKTTDANGALMVHPITDGTADAMNINEVRFTDTLAVRRIEDIEAWRISFKLEEFNSDAEKNEALKNPVGTAPTATALGTPVNADDPNAVLSNRVLTGFETMLQHVEDWLAPDDTKAVK